MQARSWLRTVALAAGAIVFLYAQWGPAPPGAQGNDKLGHVALYAGMAVLAWPFVPGADRLSRAALLVGAGFLVGAVMEAGQAMRPGRNPEALDLLADVAGLVLGVALLAAWGTAARAWRGRRRDSSAAAGAAAGADDGAAAAQGMADGGTAGRNPAGGAADPAPPDAGRNPAGGAADPAPPDAGRNPAGGAAQKP